MTHIECIRKWPAVYAFMALVMDDVMVDRDKAVDKWGAGVVRLSETYNAEAMEEDDVFHLFENLVDHLNIGATLENGSPKVVESSAPASSPSSSTSSTSSAPRPSSRARTRPPNLKRIERAEVRAVYTEEKPPQYGGGVRHKMDLALPGEHYLVEGTIPTKDIGTVQVGDIISLDAQVWVFGHRKGWFKYPKNLRVLTPAR